jgi:hypothetical protein
MFRWIFRKSGNEPGKTPGSATTNASPGAGSSAADVDWAASLAQARGDDEALLALAVAAGTPLKIKQAAVEGLDSEAALKRAERDFRSHDRRVHQFAKQRLLAKAAQRQTREQAAQLLEAARSLAAMEAVPVNRVVEIDKAWQSLDVGAIEPTQSDAFAALTAQLAEQIRQRADTELQRKHWLADAAAALRQLQATCTEAAAGTQDRGHLAGSIGAARGVASSLPPGDMAVPAAERALADLQQAIGIATTLDHHLAVLDRLLAVPAEPPTKAADASTHGPDENDPPKTEATDAAGDELHRTWQALPPLTDTPLAALLQARHERWQQARDQARQALQSHRREQARERQRARKGEEVMALADAVAQAETALDAGQLVDAHRHLSDIDGQLQGSDAPVALRSRIVVAQARLSQLRGWQYWASGRARDELVRQAEALAAATVGGGKVKGGEEGERDGADGVTAEVARLSIRQRAEVIATLRKRWKEIDGPDGDGGRALWRRFDAALTAAGGPVAAHVAAQRAAREANLSVRLQLLEGLEAVGVTAEAAPAASADMAVREDDAARPQAIHEPPAEAPADARGLASALDRFNTEWRKLGPLEHTVPRAARAALDERMLAAVRRLEVPLQEARARAGAQRLSLLARARALAGDGPVRGRDLVGEVRLLQSEWQQHARALPLARDDEQAMWADFKAAIDAAFAAREAVHSAREAEFEAHAAERSALIERLRLRLEDKPETQRRTLAEVDAAWQRCGPVPRARAAALEGEFRAARDELRRRLDDSAQRAWQSTCEALDAKLALCLAREQGAENDAAATAASWSILPVLPAPLEDAMRRRAGLAPADNPGTASDINDLLLQIESAWDLPTPPPFETARRERKLLAMKASLEGRRSAIHEALAPLAALAQLLSRDGLDVHQRSRLAAVLVAWRRQGPQRKS